MALAIATVSDSISGLSVSGLTIEDVDNLSVFIASPPVLAPMPDFITNFELIYDSFGSGATAQKTIRYDLNYRLYYAPVGSDRKLAPFEGMIDMIAAILDAVIDVVNLTGAIEIMPTGTIRPGIVLAPDGAQFFGCDLAFRITEFDN